ncbi:hypothetical protein AK51_19435 [Serratia nematodiphila DZ0503SBS1]|nr:hypothetical protein AK51_19435 [Serratia nematodiphila DZ0503SBS1]
MLVSNLSQMLPNSLPASSTEIELISSRMIVGKTVEDLHLDTVVTQKYFPIFGRGWARLMGNKPGQVALSRLTVAEPLVESAIELEVIDDQNYVVTVDKDKIFQGKVGRLENASGVSMLVSEISAKPGTVFNVSYVRLSIDRCTATYV